MDAQQLKNQLTKTAFAFRGYNVSNLGRSTELLAHPLYGDIVARYLREASQTCSEVISRRVDLVRRVREHHETTLKTYPEAICLILAMEIAQLDLLKEFFGIQYHEGKLAFGFSLGELAALVAGGVFELDEAMRIPLALANDCAALAHDVTLGVLFSRGPELPRDQVRRLCLRINHEGRGIMGISAFLSPNSMLLMGQADTIDRFKARMHEVLPGHVNVRKNKSRWPPLHTPIIRERFIPNRCDLLIHTLQGGFTPPQPPVLSLVTGKMSYNDFNSRDILCRWTDHPQLLWEAVCETLSMGIETVVHVGPEPNIFPATFKRLSENIKTQTNASLGMRALSAVAYRPWLKTLLPARTALLRAPLVKHIILEDWLLAKHPHLKQTEAATV